MEGIVHFRAIPENEQYLAELAYKPDFVHVYIKYLCSDYLSRTIVTYYLVQPTRKLLRKEGTDRSPTYSTMWRTFSFLLDLAPNRGCLAISVT